LALVDLETLYSEPRLFAEIPIDSAGVIATIAQGDLDLSDGIRLRVMYRQR
jgi:hypothetical protein